MTAAQTGALDLLADQRAAQGLEPGVTRVPTLRALASIFAGQPKPIVAPSGENTAEATIGGLMG